MIESPIKRICFLAFVLGGIEEVGGGGVAVTGFSGEAFVCYSFLSLIRMKTVSSVFDRREESSSSRMESLLDT